MLVLTRKLQEQIKIGDDVVITILQIRGQAVRIGIQAPRNVRVLRAELPQHSPVTVEEAAAPVLETDTLPTAPHASIRRPPLASRLISRGGLSAIVGSAPLSVTLNR